VPLNNEQMKCWNVACDRLDDTSLVGHGRELGDERFFTGAAGVIEYPSAHNVPRLLFSFGVGADSWDS